MIWHIPCNSNSNFRLEDCQELRSLILFLLFTTALSKGNVWYPLNRLKFYYIPLKKVFVNWFVYCLSSVKVPG